MLYAMHTIVIDLEKEEFDPPRKGKIVVEFRDVLGACLTLVNNPEVSGTSL